MKAAILHAPQQPLTIEEVRIADPDPRDLQGRLDLDHLISNSLPLAAINEGFARMRGGAPVRQIIDFRV